MTYSLFSLTIIAFIVTRNSGEWSNLRLQKFEKIVLAFFNLISILTLPNMVYQLKNKKYILAFLLFLSSIASVSILGSRLIFLSIWSVAFYWFVFQLKKSIWKKIFLLFIMGTGLAFLHASARGIRTARSVDAIPIKIIQSLKGDPTGGESKILQNYLFASELFNSGFRYGPTTLSRILFFAFPRMGPIAEVKGVDVSYDFWVKALDRGIMGKKTQVYRELQANGYTGSLHGLYWGDALLAFGLFGILTYVVLLSYLGYLTDKIRSVLSGNSFKYFIFPYYWVGLFSICRGSVSNGFLLVMFGIILSIFLFKSRQSQKLNSDE